MKIILIRQMKPFTNREEGSASGKEQSVGAAAVRRSDAGGYHIYTGTSPAAAETAELLFESPNAPEQTALLDDVSFDTEKRMPRWIMWLRWLFGGGAKAALGRLGGFIDRIEAEDRDCVVICGGFVLVLLKMLLRLRGYCLEGGELIPQPLDRVRASKQSLHCGGCHHNCLLSAPKCQIGQNKAIERQRSRSR